MKCTVEQVGRTRPPLTETPSHAFPAAAETALAISSGCLGARAGHAVELALGRDSSADTPRKRGIHASQPNPLARLRGMRGLHAAGRS
jgi:hypothetical protein